MRTPNLAEGETVEGGDGTVQKSVGEFLYAIHGNFSSLFSFACFRDIAAFCGPLFPTPCTSSLPKISPCFPGIRSMAFGLRRAKMLG